MWSEPALQAKALRAASELGCYGAHVGEDGSWMPCQSFAEYKSAIARRNGVSRISEDELIDWSSRRKHKGSKKKKKFEKLKERGIVGIQTLPSGGLVSAPMGQGSGMVSASAEEYDMSVKAVQGMYMPRDSDFDVFSDIESARRRSRQMGCIGVSRRISKSGRVVWMPCTNMTDYARRAGTTSLGRRYQRQQSERAIRTVLKKNSRKRKKSLAEELHSDKSLGRKLKNTARGIASRFDPNAIDGDNDGLVQDSTPFERPSIPSISAPKPSSVSKKQRRAPVEEWFHSMPESERESRFGPPIEEIGELDPKTRKAVDAAMSQPIRSNSGMRSATPPSTSNPRATRSNPYAELGGKAMGSIILGRVRPEHRNKKGKRTTYFIGGTSGAGKSDVLERFLQASGIVPNDDEAAHVDPDFIKMGLRGYDDGRGSSRVHADSRVATDHVIKDAVSQGMDVIVQGTGKRTEHLRGAKRNGYKTIGHFVYASDSTATRRSTARNQKGGRQIPIFSSRIASQIPYYVSEAFRDGLMDEFYLWDNDSDSPDGNLKPKLIARKVPGKKMEVFDRDKFEDFAKGKKWADQWESNANKNDKDLLPSSGMRSSVSTAGMRSRTGINKNNEDFSPAAVAARIVPINEGELEEMLKESEYTSGRGKWSIRKTMKLIEKLQVNWPEQQKLRQRVEEALAESPGAIEMIKRFGAPPSITTVFPPAISMINSDDIDAGTSWTPFGSQLGGAFVVPTGVTFFSPMATNGDVFKDGTPANHVIRHELSHGWHDAAKRKSKSASKALEQERKELEDNLKKFIKERRKETGEIPSSDEISQAIREFGLSEYESNMAREITDYAATNRSEYIAEAISHMISPSASSTSRINGAHIQMLSEFLDIPEDELRMILSSRTDPFAGASTFSSFNDPFD